MKFISYESWVIVINNNSYYLDIANSVYSYALMNLYLCFNCLALYKYSYDDLSPLLHPFLVLFRTTPLIWFILTIILISNSKENFISQHPRFISHIVQELMKRLTWKHGVHLISHIKWGVGGQSQKRLKNISNPVPKKL